MQEECLTPEKTAQEQRMHKCISAKHHNALIFEEGKSTAGKMAAAQIEAEQPATVQKALATFKSGV